jgi:Protein of unknown function (DUF2567)
VSTPALPPATDQPAAPAAGAPDSRRGRPGAASLVGWAEIRSDLRAAVLLVSALGLAGIPVGVLWWLLAPRLDFRITSAGPVPVDAVPSSEVLIADDGVFALLLAAVGLLCGVLAWRMRRRRGVATVVALAAGTAICGALAWQVGELLGPGPTRAALAQVGGRVTTSLALHSLPALAFGPFGAVLAYVVAVLYTRSDDLGRTELARPVSPRAGEALDPVS